MEQLIKDNHLSGSVLCKSITEVQPDEIKDNKRVHLFAGIGGWELALRLAGWPPEVPVWTGSCPCQPFSIAGAKRRTKDERHLWPQMFRLIEAHRPPVVFGEQVSESGGLGWLDGVCDDLERIGYSCGAAILPACCVGSPQQRNRLYWVAHCDSAGFRESWRAGSDASEDSVPERTGEDDSGLAAMRLLRGCDLQSPWDTYRGLSLPGHSRVGPDGPVHEPPKRLRVGPGAGPLANGVSRYVVRLRGYGNAIVPQAAAIFIKAFMEGSQLCVTNPKDHRES